VDGAAGCGELGQHGHEVVTVGCSGHFLEVEIGVARPARVRDLLYSLCLLFLLRVDSQHVWPLLPSVH
jgi:hypothetical protein